MLWVLFFFYMNKNISLILQLNLIMDSLAALALSTDSPSRKLLDRKPHKRNEYIISRVKIKLISYLKLIFKYRKCLSI